MTFHINVSTTLGDLQTDMARIPGELYREGRKIVSANARAGATIARASARKTAGAHGKNYPRSITADRASSYAGFGGGVIQATYGPESGRSNQADMSFEWGSRNQPPHLDLLKSADVIGRRFAADVSRMVGDLFWPGGDQ